MLLKLASSTRALARSQQTRLASTAISKAGVSTELAAAEAYETLSGARSVVHFPQRSSPMEGFSLAGALAGTMLICIAPGLLAAMAPAKSEH